MKFIYQLLLLFPATLFFSCDNDSNESPRFDLLLTTESSTKYSGATVNFSSLIFIEESKSPAQRTGQRTRNWEGGESLQLLTSPQTENIGSFPHVEMTTIGIEPDWEITLFQQDSSNAKTVLIEEMEYLELSEEVVIENGRSYTIEVNIDPDVAFKKEDDFVRLDWDGVTTRIVTN